MGAGKSAMNIHKVKPVSVAEKIRKKAAQMRKNERLGLHPKNGNEIVFEEISNTDV
jgi:topoisomerase IA-like protein